MVNQQENGGEWNLLGTFYFAADNSGSITLTDEANGYVIADAVMLRRVYQEGGAEKISVYFYHNDHLGTPQVMTDESRTVAWRADYMPFGHADVIVGAIDNNFRLPGQYQDSETGLHYNWHRYYDLGIGRYLRADPSHSVQAGGIGIGVIGIPYLLPFLLNTPQELNVYAYVQNDPVGGMDPTGLSWCTFKCEFWFFMDLWHCDYDLIRDERRCRGGLLVTRACFKRAVNKQKVCHLLSKQNYDICMKKCKVSCP